MKCLCLSGVVSVFRLQRLPECVKDIDTSKLTMLGYEGSKLYFVYEDDGVHKEYDKAENYRKLEK